MDLVPWLLPASWGLVLLALVPDAWRQWQAPLGLVDLEAVSWSRGCVFPSGGNKFQIPSEGMERMWFRVEETRTGGHESRCGFYLEGQRWGLGSPSTLSSQSVLGRADWSARNPPAAAGSFPGLGQSVRLRPTAPGHPHLPKKEGA